MYIYIHCLKDASEIIPSTLKTNTQEQKHTKLTIQYSNSFTILLKLIYSSWRIINLYSPVESFTIIA